MRPGLLLTAVVAVGSSLAGCEDDETAAADPALHGTLAMEIRDTLTVQIVPAADGAATEVSVTLSTGFGVAPAGSALTGAGRIEPFPEADATLYTARLSAPAAPAGPCGAEPISLALSLHRQGANTVVHGGLSAYCGAGRWHGTPVRVLRLSGELGTRP